MSIAHFGSLVISPVKLTLSGGTATTVDDVGNPVIAGYRFNTDGTVDRIQSFLGTPGYTQTAAATDWIQPNAAANSGYQFNFSWISGVSADYPSAIPSWQWFSASANVQVGLTKSNLGTESAKYLVRISRNGGSTILASATYSFVVTVQ